MDKPIKKPSKYLGIKTRRDMCVKGDVSITRKQFHTLVKKAAQPTKPSVSGEASTETSESQISDGCNETNTH